MPGSPQEKENSLSLSACAESQGHILSFKIAIGDQISENMTVVLEGSGWYFITVHSYKIRKAEL